MSVPVYFRYKHLYAFNVFMFHFRQIPNLSLFFTLLFIYLMYFFNCQVLGLLDRHTATTDTHMFYVYFLYAFFSFHSLCTIIISIHVLPFLSLFYIGFNWSGINKNHRDGSERHLPKLQGLFCLSSQHPPKSKSNRKLCPDIFFFFYFFAFSLVVLIEF